MLESAKGRIFNIVHGSFVDGWGIRTTVFLKGCPLRCRWCCNPESQSSEFELKLESEYCTACGQCVPMCPQNALSIDGTMISVNRSKCTACGACKDICWPGALDIWGSERTAKDVYEECLRDQAFYRRSGGGITLSGGEPTLQPEFCREMIERSHMNDIPVAVDTCGYVTTDSGRSVLQQADLLLFDIKGLDSSRHKSNTGLSNEVILSNLLHANAERKPVIIRYPIIPSYNDMEAKDIARFLASLACVKRVDLIGYHNYGSKKYGTLNRTYSLSDLPPLSEEKKQEFLSLFRSYGLNAQLGG